MNRSEVGKILAVAAVVDNRTVDREAVAVWHDLIGHLTAEEAVDALRRFRQNSPGVYLEPGHLLSEIKNRKAGHGVSYHPPAPVGTRYAVDVMDQELEQ